MGNLALAALTEGLMVKYVMPDKSIRAAVVTKVYRVIELGSSVAQGDGLCQLNIFLVAGDDDGFTGDERVAMRESAKVPYDGSPTPAAGTWHFLT